MSLVQREPHEEVLRADTKPKANIPDMTPLLSATLPISLHLWDELSIHIFRCTLPRHQRTGCPTLRARRRRYLRTFTAWPPSTPASRSRRGSNPSLPSCRLAPLSRASSRYDVGRWDYRCSHSSIAWSTISCCLATPRVWLRPYAARNSMESFEVFVLHPQREATKRRCRLRPRDRLHT